MKSSGRVRLMEVAEVRFSNVDKLTQQDEFPVQLCNYMDVYRNARITDEIEFMEATATEREIEKFALRIGDVLVTKDSETAEDVAHAAVVAEDIPRLLCGYHLAMIRPFDDVLYGPYLAQLFENHHFRAQFIRMANGVTRFGLTVEAFEKAVVPLPSRIEQEYLAELFRNWDTAIEKTVQLIAAKSQRLSFLREHRLTKPKQSRRVKLNSVTHESTARNGKRLGRDAIMAVTKLIGMRPMREETIAAAISRYKVVKPNAFAYNPMRLNIGSIAMSSFNNDILVSPDYVVFECDDSKLLPGYLNHLRRTRLWATYFEAAGSGGVRIRIYYDDLGAFAFPLPPLAEQARDLAVFDAGVVEIETLERYLAALHKQKRGLMQKLLTGQWRISIPATKEV